MSLQILQNLMLVYQTNIKSIFQANSFDIILSRQEKSTEVVL